MYSMYTMVTSYRMYALHTLYTLYALHKVQSVCAVCAIHATHAWHTSYNTHTHTRAPCVHDFSPSVALQSAHLMIQGLAPFRRTLSCIRARWGPGWAQDGSKLGPRWAPIWAQKNITEPFGALLGPSWGSLGASSARSWDLTRWSWRGLGRALGS